ncbi:nucleotidyltransferase-like protein [Paenibacillus sp. LHD-117]|uniref:nucleotidyltransferase-like protein n=1 Tax=Paenibacillus sp. LHD-117 TaxID=3071412 RepID=UPI0027DFE3C4|nr:nucleotidyltransferase-like protein [Paenibacillus sp. LHD-117]MDQ6421516.1 nucleotidyltransferase-like protein [Paenibacillus sp. LHD-117]
MEHIRTHFMDIYRDRPGLVSLAVIENPYPYNPLIDGLDLLALLVIDNEAGAEHAEHIRLDGSRALIRTVHRETLQSWISIGEHRNIIEWLVRGEILLDRDGYLAGVRERLLLFPESMREQKRFIEFIGFLRTYLQAKQDLMDGNMLDAYSHVLTALTHWAHIVLIEEGRHPELTVWKQLKRVHPGVYKLYEELTASPETLEQRVQLVMLACEFSVMSKMKSCCDLLIRIMNSRSEPWSIGELHSHPSLAELHVDLSLVIQKLVKRAYVREVAIMQEPQESGAIELRYTIMNA